ncbi:MAG: hypothetical protein IKZ78_03200, partial [Firmicutes bacterium]|nr:hypothetical protein [Bacillota bacterium]
MNSTISLKSPITDIKGIGPKKAEAFARLGLSSLSDLLWFFPRDYEDLRNIKHIKDLKNDEKALVESVVRMNVMGRGFGRKRTLHLSVSDKTRDMEVLFFMAGFMGKTFKVGECYRFFGKVKREGSKVTMFHPTFGPAGEGESGIQPVYPLTRGLTQKDVKKAVKTALAMSSELQETLPEDIISKANICPLDYALSNIHFPGDG